jgi:ABC-2 type transport system permease protein
MQPTALTPVPGVFEQVRLVAGVRWRILKNGLRKKNNVWDLIGMIWVGIFSALVVIGLCFAFFAGGYEFVAKSHFTWLSLLFWAIFLWWQLFPIFIAGFGSNFEFANLLRFPLSLRAFYLLGLGYGLSDFAAISSICWLISMIAGAATAQFRIVPALLLVTLLFTVINLTLERLAGSWLEKILARRKTRELFLGLFVLCMVSLNFLNPAFQKWGRGAKPSLLRFVPYVSWLPGSLAGSVTAAAARSDAVGFAVGLIGLFGWTSVTSVLLWRRFAAQYAGEQISESAAPTLTKKKSSGGFIPATDAKRQTTSPEMRGLLSPQVAAVFAKEFRYMIRNGFAFLQLLLPPIMVIFFTYQFGPSVLKQHSLKPAMFFPGIMAYLILILLSPAYNSFAYEGRGIQTYFMAPVRFRDVLLGKNLFLAALVTFELIFCILLLLWRVGWPGTPMFLATITAGIFAVVGQFAIANWSSLSFPKKMEIGKMKGQRNSGVAVWTAFGVQIVMMGICAVIIFAGQWTRNPWLAPLAFSALSAAALGGYAASLTPMNALAERKKEQLMDTLTR